MTIFNKKTPLSVIKEFWVIFSKDYSRGLGVEPPNINLRPRQRSACDEQDGRACRRAQAGQHNEAGSVLRTLWRGSAVSQSAGLLVLLVTKVRTQANTVRLSLQCYALITPDTYLGFCMCRL